MKKKNTINAVDLSADELIAMLSKKGSKKVVLALLLTLIILPLACGSVFALKNMRASDDSRDNLISFVSAPIAAATSKKDLISIPAGTVKANPFLPYRDINGTAVNDVPQFDLVAPPEVLNESSDAARVMDTIVSGILYDKFSPSAILNIEGNDYLVKKGDVVNNYKIMNISQNSVTVKLGSNTYNAGIGEILTEGELNKNEVSNLNKKFGGVK